MKRSVIIFGSALMLVLLFQVWQTRIAPRIFHSAQNTIEKANENNEQGGIVDTVNPLTIASLRAGQYPGSDIVIEQKLEPGSNYDRYIASYTSDGLKIYALLTVPQGDRPKSGSPRGEAGWPVIIFNHGFIPPAEYQTTERYIAYTDGFSRNGYIVFKSDYRGHGESEGQATGGYGSNAYTIDILNALASIKKYKDADPKRIGMWGHSMGGFITLRSMVVSKEIKAGVIWGGVVGSYPDLLRNWRRVSVTPPATSGLSRSWRQSLVAQYGDPDANPEFWASISANSYLKDISGPLQLHHSTTDQSVPVAFSRTLEKQMKDAKKTIEFYEYPGDDHNISANFNIAMERSVAFFDKYLK